jgi:TolB protein
MTVSVAVLCAVLLAPSANAAFPGKNGKIAFVTYTSGTGSSAIDSMNSDGSDFQTLVSGGSDPAWSPDGTTIAFEANGISAVDQDGGNRRLLTDVGYAVGYSPDGSRIATTDGSCFGDPGGGTVTCNYDLYVANADGSGLHSLYEAPPDIDDLDHPRWSPDGTKIAFNEGNGVWTINTDGSGAALVPNTTSGDNQGGEPDWSPDGSRIVFGLRVGSNADIYTIKPDGSDLVRLTTDPASDRSPAWSPDGTKIVFVSSRADPNPVTCASYGSPCNWEIYTMNASGGGEQRITNRAGFDVDPDWQPLPINTYPRPKGATPFQTYLTVAYKPCASPNEQHGAPLAVLSCSPPQQASDFLTVGTLDANGQAAKAVGSIRYDVKPGNALTPTDEADVKVNVSIKDVRMKSDLSDYSGELGVTSSRRITDKLNTPAPDGTTGAATTQDTPLSITVPCAPTTADDTIGSLCALSTTADAIVAGQVKEEMRSNWELGQVQVYDGGADADADTTSDNTLFMDEGIFVP